MKSSVDETLNQSESEHSLFRSLAVGGVFQIKGEVDDSHLNGKAKLITVYLDGGKTRWRKPVSTHLRIKILPFNAEVGVDYVEAHQQPPHHRPLLLHHQRSGVIKLTRTETDMEGVG